MSYPMTVADRSNMRTQRENMGAARGKLIEVRGYQSINCQDGRHAGSRDGCSNNGLGCLCACHDDGLEL